MLYNEPALLLIKRICGHSSPYTFKPNERYGKQRFEKFLSKKCPQCTTAAIAALEQRQKEEAAAQRALNRKSAERPQSGVAEATD